jgi:hypothetical protein
LKILIDITIVTPTGIFHIKKPVQPLIFTIKKTQFCASRYMAIDMLVTVQNRIMIKINSGREKTRNMQRKLISETLKLRDYQE